RRRTVTERRSTTMTPANDLFEQAMRAVPRAPFLPPHQRHHAHVDAPVPIWHGQTNSQPYTVATMLTLLGARAGQRVLDLEAGSRWSTALLRQLVGQSSQVIGVERQAELFEPARGALAEAGTGPHAEIRAASPGVLGAPKDGSF